MSKSEKDANKLWCNACGKYVKIEDNFHNNSSKTNGLQAYCELTQL